MFSRKSEGGRDLVPTIDPENSSVAHNVMEESDPIFENTDSDDYARYIIGNDDGEDSYEAEEDAAHTVTNVYRQRKKQQKKATLRNIAIAAIVILLIISVSLGIFFSLRKNQQQAFNASNSKNSNGTSETTGATIPLPSTPSPSASLPTNITKSPSIAPVIAIGTKAPSISPIASLQGSKVPFNIPQNFTPDTLEVPDVDLTNICGTSSETNDLTKCEAECSKGLCCWSTNTCVHNVECYLYKPCEILKQIAPNSTNTTFSNVTEESSSYGGCAAESPGSQTLECFPTFLPCRTDKDCEDQMLNLGVFVNCTDTCSELAYTVVPDNIVYGINISDAIHGFDNVLNNMMDGNNSISFGPFEVFNETDAFTSLTDNSNNSSFNSLVDTVSNVLDVVDSLTDNINISFNGDNYNSPDMFTGGDENSSNISSTDSGFIDTVLNALNIVSDLTSNNNSAFLTDDYYAYYVSGNSSANLYNTADLVWNRITFDDFQSDWGNFKDGGDDAKLVHISMSDGDETNTVARLRDNSKESVMRLKEAKDTTQYDALRVKFWLETEKVDRGDELLLEYSSDGGSNWEIVKEWIFGEDADLNDNGIVYQLNVTFYSTDYVFSDDSFIRFRSDASSDSDHFYIDNVEFEGAKSIQ